MKKFENKLFQKLEDKKIFDETARQIKGGTAPHPSHATGDHDPTGGGADCADWVNGRTDVITDSIHN